MPYFYYENCCQIIIENKIKINMCHCEMIAQYIQSMLEL